ncbi:MAG: pyruvate kinase, partial [Dehalococcoidia bacterium]
PSRAEASDVANAVWEYADALMLSAETAIGQYPVLAVAMMDRIIRRAEAAALGNPTVPGAPLSAADDHPRIVALAARRIVETDPNMRAIVCFTNSGYTATLASKQRVTCPIFAISPSATVARRLSMARSVIPLQSPAVSSLEEMMAAVDRLLVEGGHVAAGEEVTLIASLPVKAAGTTNFLKLHRLGESQPAPRPRRR